MLLTFFSSRIYLNRFTFSHKFTHAYKYRGVEGKCSTLKSDSFRRSCTSQTTFAVVAAKETTPRTNPQDESSCHEKTMGHRPNCHHYTRRFGCFPATNFSSRDHLRPENSRIQRWPEDPQDQNQGMDHNSRGNSHSRRVEGRNNSTSGKETTQRDSEPSNHTGLNQHRPTTRTGTSPDLSYIVQLLNSRA